MQIKPKLKSMLEAVLRKTPFLSGLVRQRDGLLAERDALLKASGFVPPGHFYSPIVAIDDAIKDERRIFGSVPRELPGIAMNESQQLELLESLEELYRSIDLPSTKAESHRYFYENPAYGYSDAVFLHCMLRHVKPRQVIEVGSGYSSCAMLDTNDRHLDGLIQFTFIEPYPDLLKSLIRDDDFGSIQIVPKRLQDVPVSEFARLQSGDFLFIDSTHVSKTGSDVNYLLSEILPALNDGVFVHIHDVFYPFEYPKQWVLAGRSWNEIYAVRAFLQYNSRFRIVMMNTFLKHFHHERLAERMPLCLKGSGGSIWLRKEPAV